MSTTLHTAGHGLMTVYDLIVHMNDPNTTKAGKGPELGTNLLRNIVGSQH